MDTDARSNQEFRFSVDSIGAVVRRWKSITFWTLLATVLAGAGTFLLPKRYRATAQLLINPSPYKSSSIEQAPLDVDTYKEMLRPSALVAEVKNHLGLNSQTVEQLKTRMRVDVIKRPNIQRTTYAPLILLHVTGEDPQNCQAIVNAWAETATSMSLRIKTAVIKQDNERIQSQYAATTISLECKEDEQREFDITAQLEERKAELEVVRKQLSAEQTNLEQLRVARSVAQSRVGSLKRQYESFFVDNVWVGSLDGGVSETAPPIDSTRIESIPRQLSYARNALVANTRVLANYKTRERVEINAHEYEVLSDTIERLSREMAATTVEYEQSKAELVRLESAVSNIPQVLLVSKAISDEALWSTLTVNPKALDELTSKRLTSEEINPVWLSMHGRIESLKPETAALEARLESQTSLLAQMRERQSTVYASVARQTLDTQNLETELLLANERYETLSRRFLLISEEIMFEESKNDRLAEEVANSERQVARLTTAALALNKYTVTKTLEKERLIRELTSLKNLYTTLATKYEEARITELEVSGDLQVAFLAPPPDDSIGPNRMVITGSAFMCALIFFFLLAIVREYIEQQSAGA